MTQKKNETFLVHCHNRSLSPLLTLTKPTQSAPSKDTRACWGRSVLSRDTAGRSDVFVLNIVLMFLTLRFVILIHPYRYWFVVSIIFAILLVLNTFCDSFSELCYSGLPCPILVLIKTNHLLLCNYILNLLIPGMFNFELLLEEVHDTIKQ